MKNLLEPYPKENCLLQLPLFYFGKSREDTTFVQWKDSEGVYSLKCVCIYGVPGSLEQDVYTASMRIWLKQGMPSDGIKLNYSDICRELHLFPAKNYVSQIKEALIKLAQARYEFKQCFLLVTNGEPNKIDTHFSLYDSASLFSYHKENPKSKRNSESKLIFPKEIQQNLEARYYQLLDMVWYRKLPEGLARRLYEYLEKRKYHNINGTFSIAESALCRWLPICDKNPTNRRKRLAKISQALIDAEYLLSYKFDRTKRMCNFIYAKKLPLDELEKVLSEKNSLDAPEEKQASQKAQTILAKPEISQETITPENQKLYLEAFLTAGGPFFFHFRFNGPPG